MVKERRYKKPVPKLTLGGPAIQVPTRTWSEEDEAEYQRRRAYWRDKLQPIADACDASERLTAEDYAVLGALFRGPCHA